MHSTGIGTGAPLPFQMAEGGRTGSREEVDDDSGHLAGWGSDLGQLPVPTARSQPCIQVRESLPGPGDPAPQAPHEGHPCVPTPTPGSWCGRGRAAQEAQGLWDNRHPRRVARQVAGPQGLCWEPGRQPLAHSRTGRHPQACSVSAWSPASLKGDWAPTGQWARRRQHSRVTRAGALTRPVCAGKRETNAPQSRASG